MVYRLLVIVVLLVMGEQTVMAQPKPGKEKIVPELPDEYRWKSKKIRKESRGLRGTAYTVRGKKKAETAPVKLVTVSTIDRRYYPMKAEGTPEEKLAYEQSVCPEAELEVVDKKVTDGRTTILYAIKSTRKPATDQQSPTTDTPCGTTTLLTYVVEGPTAFHTVEVVMPENQLTPELYAQWCAVLLQSRIE